MHTKKSAKAKYAHKEIQYAMNKQKRTVLHLLDNTPLDNYFLFQFGTQDYIDYNKAEEREKLFKNICSWLGKGETTPQPKETITPAMTEADEESDVRAA